MRGPLQVANLPLVPNLPIPKELFEIDQRKIVGLLLDPSVMLLPRTLHLSGAAALFRSLHFQHFELPPSVFAPEPNGLLSGFQKMLVKRIILKGSFPFALPSEPDREECCSHDLMALSCSWLTDSCMDASGSSSHPIESHGFHGGGRRNHALQPAVEGEEFAPCRALNPSINLAVFWMKVLK